MGSGVRFLADEVRTVVTVPVGENRLALTELQRQEGKRASREQRRLYPDLPKCASRQTPGSMAAVSHTHSVPRAHSAPRV